MGGALPESMPAANGAMSEPGDRVDIELARAGHGDAYARIVARHQEGIGRRLRAFTREPLVLEELAQEVFVQAYYSLPKYRGDGPLAAWLARIATRVGYAHWKARDRRREQIRDDDWWREIGAGATTRLDPTRAAQLVARLLDELAPRDRLALLLLHVEGRSVDEAARLAGWSRTMLKVQAFRARRKLRTLLEARGIDSLAALEASPESIAEIAPIQGTER